MTSGQIIFFGSAACVALAFISLLIAIVRENLHWKRVLSNEKAKREALERRFSVIVDADAEAARIEREAQASASIALNKAAAEVEEREHESKALVASLSAQIPALAASLEEVRRTDAEKKSIFDRLAKEVAAFDERLAFAEMGVYEPHFDFDASEDFKAA